MEEVPVIAPEAVTLNLPALTRVAPVYVLATLVKAALPSPSFANPPLPVTFPLNETAAPVELPPGVALFVKVSESTSVTPAEITTKFAVILVPFTVNVAGPVPVASKIKLPAVPFWIVSMLVPLFVTVVVPTVIA